MSSRYPQPMRSWVGDVTAQIVCRATTSEGFTYDAYYDWIGYEPLTNLFEGEYNSLRFHIGSEMVNRLKTPGNSCRVEVAVNSNDEGWFRLDNMGFVQ